MSSHSAVMGTWLRRVAEQLPFFPRALALVWQAVRYRSVVWLGLQITQGILPAATVYLTRFFVDSFVALLQADDPWLNMRPTIVFAALLGATLLLGEALRGLTGWIFTAQAETIRDHISGLIHEQSVRLDLAFYETPEYYDHLYRARFEASYRPVALLGSIGGLLQNGITLATMSLVLIPYGLWLPILLLLSTLPAFYAVIRYRLREHDWFVNSTEDERKSWYVDWLLTSREAAAELRLFGLGDHFRSSYRDLRQRLREGRLKLVRDHGLIDLAAGSAALLLTGAVMAWMAWRTLQGFLTLGDLALFYQAFSHGQRLMHSLQQNMGELYANSLFLGNLFEFLELQPQVVSRPQPGAPPPAVSQHIRFRGVTFGYPGSQRTALRNLDLTINAGEMTAIVGDNGSGKSTLFKLLCRLYDPDSGSIEIDGVDIRSLPLEGLQRCFTMLFQDSMEYNQSAADNLLLSDPPPVPDMDRLRRAAQTASAEEIIQRLPDGYDTLLGRWFTDGVELSAGEWRRIALARTLLREAPVILLDEPTSAMDPWAENQWLKQLKDLSRGRTVVVITHRFAIAMHADIIHVMKEGQIIESGRHADLVARRGYYAQTLWSQSPSEDGPSRQ